MEQVLKKQWWFLIKGLLKDAEYKNNEEHNIIIADCDELLKILYSIVYKSKYN